MKTSRAPTLFQLLTGIVYSFLMLNCGPLMTSSSYLYSSSDLNTEDGSSNNVHSIAGLQDQTLHRLFNTAACDDFNSHVWNHVFMILFDQSPPPAPSVVKEKIKKYSKNYLLKKGSGPRIVRDFSAHFVNIYSEALEFFSKKSEEVISEQLAQIDLLSDSTKGETEDYFKSNAQIIHFLDKVQQDFDNLEKLTKAAGLQCDKIYPNNVIITKNTNIPFLSTMKEDFHPLVYGARKTMATAYQSCDVLDLPLIPSKNPNTSGIVKTSYHKSGGGIHRSISSLSSLNRSHYYLRHSTVPLNNQCMDISKNPLIYDFGGKPFFRTYPYPHINLFKNAGSGSEVLGLDCSGFVLSSLASAGLRVQSKKPISPSHISGIGSWMLTNPSAHKLNCLREVSASASQPIKAGDIITTNNHVAIVDQVGSDPLGISRFHSPQQCRKENISPQQFHFSVIHSSPIFNGIGINRIHINHTQQPNLKKGFVQLASNLCYKKFGYKVSNKVEHITISRHTLSPECREDEVYLQGQECLSSCLDSFI